MNEQSHQERIRVLYQMLFEMAMGNHEFRMQLSDMDDELDALASQLNAIAAEIRGKILNAGFVIPNYYYQNLIRTIIILDNDLIIQSFNHDLPLALGYESEELHKMDFHSILAQQALPAWGSIKSKICSDAFSHDSIYLEFVTAEKEIIPSFCSISRLIDNNTIIVNTITTILQDVYGVANHLTPKPAEALLVQNVCEFILNALDKPLPNAKELSKMFGTNEFKLKKGFRHFYNTSIYQFYVEQRLKKAHQLIQQTAISIKTIAEMSGYNDYTNFYKSFKKRYSYSPSDLKRITLV